MDFQKALTFNDSNLCAWSPSGRFLAVISSQNRLVLRDASNLEVLRTEVISASSNIQINTLQFSPDSQFLLASDFANGLSFVYRTATDKDSLTWKAKIVEGLSGITDIRWAPDSRHVISLSEFSIKLTVWSLIQKVVRYIKFPKKKECIAFSPNGSYLGVVERRENKDCLSLFACSKDWGVAKHFELFPDMDTNGLIWNAKSSLMAVYSSKLQCITCVYALDGRCLFIFKPNEIGISLSSVAWSHCGNILAIATSSSVSIMNCLTWSLVSELKIPVSLSDKDGDSIHLFVEMDKPLRTEDVDVRVARELCRNPLDTEYVGVKQRPVELLPAKKSAYKKVPTVELEFSTDNKYLLAKSNLTHVVWIWEVQSLKLSSILVHQKSLAQTLWSPRGEKLTSLLILTTDGMMHLWTSHGAICLSLPPLDQDYGKIKGIEWNPLGRALALTCQDGIVCCRVGSRK